MGIGIFTLALAANESREAAIAGEYFELRNAVYPVALIELLDRTGGVIARLDNPEQSDFVKPGRYETVRITNGATPQTVKHFYGTGDAGSRRTSGLVKVDGTVSVMGNVSVIDGEKSRTLAGGMFVGTPTITSSAGQYPFCQLWNPPGSGKNLIVTQLDAGSAGGQLVAVSSSAAAYATDMTASAAGNKMIGAAMGVAQVRVQGSASPVLAQFKQIYLPASVTSTWVIKGAIVVAPGLGLVLMGQTVASTLNVNFEWFEEPI